MEKLLIKAENSRWKCTGCGNTIFKGELLFRSILRAWRDSHTVNLCRKCIIRMFLEWKLKIDDGEFIRWMKKNRF